MFAEVINKVAALDRIDDAKPYYPRPSLAGPERCIRKTVYHALGVIPRPLPGRAVLVMDDSTMHEELTYKWCEKTAYRLFDRQRAVSLPAPGLLLKGFVCGICSKAAGHEVVIPPETMHGHLDWLAEHEIAPGVALIEHKALSTWGVRRYSAGELPIDYFTQASIYARALHEDIPDLSRVILLIKDKNSARYLEYECIYFYGSDTLLIERRIESNGDAPALVVEMGDALARIVESALEIFREVERYRESETIPDRPYEFGTDFPCGYCLYEKTCWESYEAECAARATLVQLGDDAAKLAAEYDRQRKIATAAEDRKDEIKEQIAALLVAQGAGSGVAGTWQVEYPLRHRKAYTVAPTTFHQLTVKRAKGVSP